MTDFWNEADTEELLKMSEADVVAKLQELAAEYSTSNVIIIVDNKQVHFECID